MKIPAKFREYFWLVNTIRKAKQSLKIISPQRHRVTETEEPLCLSASVVSYIEEEINNNENQ